jgi:hypothetical protein
VGALAIGPAWSELSPVEEGAPLAPPPAPAPPALAVGAQLRADPVPDGQIVSGGGLRVEGGWSDAVDRGPWEASAWSAFAAQALADGAGAGARPLDLSVAGVARWAPGRSGARLAGSVGRRGSASQLAPFGDRALWGEAARAVVVRDHAGGALDWVAEPWPGSFVALGVTGAVDGVERPDALSADRLARGARLEVRYLDAPFSLAWVRASATARRWSPSWLGDTATPASAWILAPSTHLRAEAGADLRFLSPLELDVSLGVARARYDATRVDPPDIEGVPDLSETFDLLAGEGVLGGLRLARVGPRGGGVALRFRKDLEDALFTDTMAWQQLDLRVSRVWGPGAPGEAARATLAWGFGGRTERFGGLNAQRDELAVAWIDAERRLAPSWALRSSWWTLQRGSDAPGAARSDSGLHVGVVWRPPGAAPSAAVSAAGP